MKRDKWFLLISLAIIVISGIIIYYFQSRQTLPDNHPAILDSQSQESIALVNEIAELKQQLETDPENFGILLNLGNDYYDLDNPTESVKYYEMALTIRPDVPEIMVDCGTMYRRLGQTDKAVDLFTRASKLAPDLPQAYYNLGDILISEKNDPEGAVKVWQDFLDNNPGIPSKIKGLFRDRISQAPQTE